jgi:hypothetical protein
MVACLGFFAAAEAKAQGRNKGGWFMPFDIDRRVFISSLGGAATVGLMSHEARADALEDYSIHKLDEVVANSQQNPVDATPEKFPTMAELEARIDGSPNRRGAGSLFAGSANRPIRRLPPMPAQPRLMDFFKLRFQPANHVLQSATRAMRTSMSEEVILACLLHDVVQSLIKVDHGWWGAQMFEPYVPEKTTFAVRFHQALRFYADEANGYQYPDLYRRIFGSDYTPEPYIEDTYRMVRKHKWYMEPRMVTVNDLYAFDPNAVVSIDPFTDIIGRHFKQPKEGLGFDNSPVAHMWRSIAFPDHPL